MNIGMLGHKDFPSRNGGIEVVVGEMAPRLVARGEKVSVYNRGKTEEAPKHTVIQGVDVYPCLTLKAPGINAFVASVSATLKALKNHHDVIHFHAIGPAGMTFLAKKFNVPCVTTIHGLDWQRKKWGNGAVKYLKWCEKNLVNYSDEIIVLSKDVHDYYLDTYGRETHIIRNGISPLPHLLPNLIRKKWNLAEDEYILYLGRLTPEKGVDYLIRAFRQIDTDKRLIIAGGFYTDDEYCMELKNLAEGDDRIQFVGFVSGDTLIELYDNCCAYCLPSEIEGMSLTLLEALSSGAHCLVSDIPENVDVAPEYLYTFKSRDVDDLRDKLEKLIHTERDRKLRYAQKDFISEKYNWEDVIDSTMEVYQKAIDKHKK